MRPSAGGRIVRTALPLIAAGAAATAADAGFNGMCRSWAPRFRHRYDDYLQYAPAVLMVGLKAFGYEGRSSWGRMLVADAFAAAIMAATVNACKYSFRVRRPDGSARNSFPSGHTATAFMTAAMLDREYGVRSPWFGIGGYAAATLVAVTRQLNNRHWMSDVLVGAGIGVLSTEAAYLLADLFFRERGLRGYSDGYALRGRLAHPSFCEIGLGYAVMPGRYRGPSGCRLAFGAAPAAYVRGAWFATPYVGIGGRAVASRAHVRIDGTDSGGTIESLSAGAGPSFSYPLSAQWLVGAHLTAGWERSRSCRTTVGALGGRDGFLFGSGLSMTGVVGECSGVRLSVDWDSVPPLVKRGGRLHRLTFGVGVAFVL